MARISGVNIPTNKKINIALTYIFGIGPKIAGDICSFASIDINKRVSELNDEELNKINGVSKADTEKRIATMGDPKSDGTWKKFVDKNKKTPS